VLLLLLLFLIFVFSERMTHVAHLVELCFCFCFCFWFLMFHVSGSCTTHAPHLCRSRETKMVCVQFGHSGSSLHTLDLYSASVLQASLQPGFSPRQEFRSLMQELATTSCEAYRKYVHSSEDFVR
jgi:hypothetical protein